MENNEKSKLFENELKAIKSDDLQTFATYLIENADDYFFTVPASSLGKYHPQFSLGDGGLVRHTKAVFYFTNEFADASMKLGDITEREKDMLLVAALVHDIKKQGDGNAVGHTMMKEHPLLAANYLRKSVEASPLFLTISPEEVEFMGDVVERHMGPWGDKVPQTAAQKLLFYADYSASRKDINLNIFGEGYGFREVVKEETLPQPADIGERVIGFGKYRNQGKTLNMIYESDLDYLQWVANKEDFFNSEFRKTVIDFLEKKKQS